jgi:endonuclease/exonuclease/phosphatase family metal-dependent hydrolase
LQAQQDPKTKREQSPAAALVAGLAFVAALGFAPDARAEAPTKLRILTWNVWGLPAVSTNLEARISALPDAIAKVEPDVVLLQEVWAQSDGDRLRQGLEQRGYAYVSHLAHTEFGMTGLLTASKLPLRDIGFHPFASGRIGHSFWHLEWIASKGVGSYLLQTPLGPVELQNTHLQAQYDTDGYAAERLSQVSEILMMPANKGAQRPLVLGGDFNTGSEELPRQALLELGELRDTTPSPEPDTIFVRNGGTVEVRIVGSRHVLTEPVRLENGVTTVLSDHPAVLVDLELSSCTACAPAVADPRRRATTHDALLVAAAITPWRVTLALSTAAGLFAFALAFFRRTRELHGRSLTLKTFRRLSLALLATGFIWTAYLGALYYPARAKALRLVAHELEAP